jgi:hypothetical protein
MESTIARAGAVAVPPRRRIFPARVRLTILTAHIMMSVGLLGDSAGFLAVAIRAANSPDRDALLQLEGMLEMFSLVFGIPLSIGALVTGVLLGLGTKWGVFRYPWVTAKLLLVVSVMLVGALIIGPTQDAILTRRGDDVGPLIGAAAYDVAALALATILSVFKPGRAFRRSVSAEP